MNKELNILEAIEVMEQGKIVKDTKGPKHRIDGNNLECYNEGHGRWEKVELDILTLSKRFYILVEEEKTLSDEVIIVPSDARLICGGAFYKEDKVQTAIQKIKDKVKEHIKDFPATHLDVDKIIDEIVGDI